MLDDGLAFSMKLKPSIDVVDMSADQTVTWIHIKLKKRSGDVSVCLSGEVWWNPEKLDTNTCCYLGLMSRLFSIFISGAAEGPTAGSFRDLMRLLVQVRARPLTAHLRLKRLPA